MISLHRYIQYINADYKSQRDTHLIWYSIILPQHILFKLQEINKMKSCLTALSLLYSLTTLPDIRLLSQTCEKKLHSIAAETTSKISQVTGGGGGMGRERRTCRPTQLGQAYKWDHFVDISSLFTFGLFWRLRRARSAHAHAPLRQARWGFFWSLAKCPKLETVWKAAARAVDRLELCDCVALFDQVQ